MALKGNRKIVETEGSYICNDVVDEKGRFLCFGTSGSGVALADNAGYVTLKANPSGFTPAGLCLSTFVSIDQTRQHRNFHKEEQLVGEKAALLQKGWVVTNQYTGSPTVGATAYITTSGVVTPTNGGAAATPKVGMFLSIPDESGYVKLEVCLPAI